MNLNFDSREPEVRAQIQLLKSHIEHKAFLNYEISRLRIESSYRNSADSKDLKDMMHLCKLLNRRLSTIRFVSQTLKQIRLKEVTKETLEELSLCIKEIEPKLDVERNVFSLNFKLETTNDEMQERLRSLSEEYQAKILKSNELQVLLEDYDFQVSLSENLERETSDYLQEVLHYKHEINEMLKKKARVAARKRDSVEKVKIFQLLSADALQLRSKLLLKEELVKSIQSAEGELDRLQVEINEKQIKMQEFESEKEEFLKNSARFEVDFYELRKRVKKLEIQLESLTREKTDLSENPKALVHSQGSLNEGETISFPSILSGLKQIQKEKASLFEENLKLKEKLNHFLEGKE